MIKTIQITLDETLLNEVDTAVQELGQSRPGLNRSDFIRAALELALKQRTLQALQQKQIAGYTRTPQHPADVAEWADEQDWGQP